MRRLERAEGRGSAYPCLYRVLMREMDSVFSTTP